MKSSSDIRRDFLEFFGERDHRVVSSSPLVPANDPTLLFTNAGMVQFKDVFLGAEKRSYARAVTSQRCVRAGGKHNDLDQVGYTARHHTFFEMLGNFSFGDYFKEEAIRYAWEFLTDVCGLPPEKLWVTVYEEDDEAADIWLKQIGVPEERFARIGAKDNFWAMGDTGPCGPCTEIFYDHGPEIAGGPPGTPEEDGDRYVEIWNLVFMQFDRDASGNMKPLPKPCVDTGMGLERLAAVLQGVHDNYEIDLFQALIRRAAELTGTEDHGAASLKVIADHIRACAFLIVDGVLPGNEGRGYVLRRIIRRAVRHGYKLGASKPFFHSMVPALVEEMGEAYPELADKGAFAGQVLHQEEQRFFETLAQGMRLLEETIENLSGDTIPGETVFKLYDTFGFPADLTADVARERGLKIDQAGFDKAMGEQRERGRAAAGFGSGAHIETEVLSQLPKTEFTGYTDTRDVRARIVAILVDGKARDRVADGEEATIVMDRTPFYAESGGQVGDTGSIVAPGGAFAVKDTVKLAGTYHGHFGRVANGSLSVDDEVTASIDEDRRTAIVLNHSATHLMHAALRTVLGDHVEQKGSLVAPDRLRFDFSHFQPVSRDQLREIEDLVNRQIRRNEPADEKQMAFDEAIEAGAMALFGEKYGEEVRVMRFGEFSVELCGGTHVERVGDIGLFKIISETGIAAGIRRIEAVTGEQAVQFVRSQEQRLAEAAGALKASPESVPEKVNQLLGRNRELEKELERLKQKLASAAGRNLSDEATAIGDHKCLVAQLPEADPKALRETVDQLKQKLGSAAIVLASSAGERVHLVAGVTKDLTDRIKAGELINVAAAKVDGRGGGRPDMAQAGGSNPDGIPAAVEAARAWLEERLSAAE
ncbi:MAG: alanine--tRNA ligase [Xanthomonadales bacterium]|nr:alanine--tRNA ligase [Xanthomonadales bacterium]